MNGERMKADRDWNRVSRKHRELRSQPPAEDDTAPFGFSTRVVAKWSEWRADAHRRAVAAWERMSIRAAIFGVAAVVVVAAVQFWNPVESHSSILIPPAVEVPGVNLSGGRVQ